ncbi:MAG TPA: exodeoxyribonuclease VII small subunit [Aeromonadales bacterium]|nr:exodeoxyribonuclease VII small subunit [Aeromonadales bacterium]
MTSASKAVDFETQLAELEKLVESMETGNLSLEDSLKSFEKGVNLTRSCLKTLKKAELKVQKLSSLDVDAELTNFQLDE